METGHILAFNLVLLAAIASPGPALLYAMRASLSGGRKTGIATGCGLAVMAATWTLLALAGLEGFFRLFPWAYFMFKAGGAFYLLFIAWQTWRDAHKPVAEASRPNTRAFVGGVFVNLANPKSVLFAAAVILVVFPPDLTAADKALIVANHLLVEIVIYTAFAVLLTTRTISERYLQAKPLLDRFAAIVLGGLAARLIVER